MTARINKLLERTFDKEQKKFRRDVDWKPLLERFVAEGTRDEARARIGLEEMLKAETPAFMDGERLAFLRTVKRIPDLHTDAEMEARRASGTAFGEKGVVFNLTADFGPTIHEAEFFAEVQRRADVLVEKYRHVEILPGPFVSVISTGCIENARDLCKGAKYNNFGIHGTGIAVAVDSLASVRELVFEKKMVSLPELVTLLDTDFAGRPDVLAAAKAAPKMGNADPRADEIAKRVIDFWGHAFDGRRNDRGGVFRPGTGSAMYYIWHARDVPASADGRLKGEPLSANWAPALDVPVKGPISVVRSFTEPDLGLVCNGGPLTIEIHDSAFSMPDGVEKVAQLVKFFIARGGHQMQINTINRETLLDAQKHPERHRHLIVRVWGWSGYFIELDKEYQDQIIKRVEL